MKNVFQELIKSPNKEDQASCEIEDLEESSNRRIHEFLKKKSFLDTPQTPVLMANKGKRIWFSKR